MAQLGSANTTSSSLSIYRVTPETALGPSELLTGTFLQSLDKNKLCLCSEFCTSSFLCGAELLSPRLALPAAPPLAGPPQPAGLTWPQEAGQSPSQMFLHMLSPLQVGLY